MSLYTKTGDHGSTGMLNGSRVQKTDDRIELIGTIDELNSHLGLVKVIAPSDWKESLTQIQKNLMVIMSSLSDWGNSNFKLSPEHITWLEQEIDRIETLFPRKKGFVLYGECELSARLDVARAVTRRADRRYAKVIYDDTTSSMKYINRLADYLYILARYADFLNSSQIQNSDEIASSQEENTVFTEVYKQQIEMLVIRALEEMKK